MAMPLEQRQLLEALARQAAIAIERTRMDVVLDGREAIVEAIERDFDNRVQLAGTVVDDPGRDLGMDRFPGHRFFFGPHEMERLSSEPAP